MNVQDLIAVEAATDGACSGNPGAGGWGGLILFENGQKLEIGGAEKNTTNNRMELTAAIKILEKLQDLQIKKDFKLRTDSKYVIEGYTNWINNWKKNGWRTSNGKVVQNLDLWQKIDCLRINGLQMEFVKGHNGDPHNERVDQIATNYSKGIMQELLDNENNTSQRSQEIDFAPLSMSKLFSRFELVQEFAQKGYLLKSNELCDLLAIDDISIIKKHQRFQWRNWEIVRENEEYWKIINQAIS